MLKPDTDDNHRILRAVRNPRCALVCAIVGSIVACIPPNGGTWSPSPSQPSGSYDGRDDEYDDQYADDGVERSAPPANGGGACTPVCRRIAECKITSFQKCADACGQLAEQGRAPAASHAKDSCDSLAAIFAKHRGSSKSGTSSRGPGPSRSSSSGLTWYCRAQGSTTRRSSSGDGGANPITIVNKGPTRDDAYYNAFSDCGSMVTLELSQSQAAGAPAEVTSECRVTDCWSAK